MSHAVALLVVALVSVTLVWSLVLLALNRPLDDPLFWALAIVEVALLAQSGGGFVAMATTSRSLERLTFGAYLVTIAIVLPIAVLWGVSDKSRWGTGVVSVGCFTVIVLSFRLLQIWSAGA